MSRKIKQFLYSLFVHIGFYISLDRIFDKISYLLMQIRLKRLQKKGKEIHFIPQGSCNFHIYGDLEKFEIDPSSHIKSDTFIECNGGVKIGKHFHVGSGLKIFSSNHDYKSYEKIPYGNQDILKPVVICDFVWVGANVSITPGVTIGEGAVIAMSSVVTRDVLPGMVVGGNPARVIGQRNMTKFEQLKSKGSII